jgi:hypothetical protein
MDTGEGSGSLKVRVRRSALRSAAAVLLPVLVFGSLAACGKNLGGLLLTDSLGDQHLLVTDANKNTITNEAGLLVVLETDAAGAVLTQADGSDATALLEYPCFVTKKWGKTVLEIAGFTVKLPKHWMVLADSKRILIAPETEDAVRTKISYASHKEGYAALKEQFLAREADANAMFKENEANASVRSFTKEFFGKEAIFLEYNIPGIDEGTGMMQLCGIVQPGDFCVEVFLECPASEYENGKLLFDRIGLIEPK